jgi:hypothetical protein
MNTKLTTITPQMASTMLKSNTCNRKIRMNHVNRLKTEILAGRWLVTHQGIAFADDGSLIDGQHRLMAIEASGRSVQIMVTHGIQKYHNGDINLNTMDVIDCGKPRGVADQLHLMHGISQANVVVGTLNMIAKQIVNINKWQHSLSVGQAVKMLEIYGDSITSLLHIAQVSKLCRKSSIIAGLAIAHPIAPGASEKFMKNLYDGSGIGVGDPVYALRESLIAYPPTGTETERTNLFLRVTTALYNTIKEVPIKTAKVSKIGLEYFITQDKKNVSAVRALMAGE